MTGDRPHLVIVGGPNGSGKTTIARELERAHGLRYLGADAIAEELAPGDWERVRIQAGRLFLERARTGIEDGRSLLVESTLSGRTLVGHRAGQTDGLPHLGRLRLAGIRRPLRRAGGGVGSQGWSHRAGDRGPAPVSAQPVQFLASLPPPGGSLAPASELGRPAARRGHRQGRPGRGGLGRGALVALSRTDRRDR